jgi:hypothetical protein
MKNTSTARFRRCLEHSKRMLLAANAVFRAAESAEGTG